ncbi:MAG TPA: hypothetical protein VHV81_13225 [Steroidobacteraceae bacterium]|nr:hypothetical protein [Steroidobacteraceae bacterium]
MSVMQGVAADAEGMALARFNDLFVVLEDLIKRVADTDDPDIRHKRAEVREKLVRLEHDTSPISECARGIGREGAPAAAVALAAPAAVPQPREHAMSEPMLTAALAGAAFTLTLISAR